MKQKLIFTIIVTAMCIFNLSAQHNHDHSHGNRVPSKGMAAMNNKGVFALFEFDRHAVGDNDVLIEIMYSGICHSDLHHVLEDWRKETYPLVPGHEMAGRVTQVGKNVTKFKVGDYAGVGCMVNSCGQCEHCKAGEEQYCENGRVLTYGSKDIYHNNEMTQGGYSSNIVVSELFAIKIPENADMKRIAPLLCAGITTYSPIKYTNVKKSDKVGVAGFGGLGHMAVQYAVTLGAEVTVFDITEDKRQAAQDMGAVKYVNVNNSEELEGLKNTFDVIISTIPTKYDPRMYVNMLKIDGSLAVVGLPANKDVPSIDLATLVFQGRRKIFGSQIGGIKETQEMIDYSVKNNIYPQVEIIAPSQITEAYKKVAAGEVHFRYVIDMSKL
ncbi:MAG: NAD(P)-dependent alcohol dehydrogenase [Dysgonomonas sp.]